MADISQDALPDSIQTQIRTDLATHLSVPSEQITIQSYSRSDSCPGLGGPAESCLAVLTEGWQIEATDTETNETHIYQTNLNGEQIRREP
ncbi:MAG: hypothetical protein AAGI45_08895 [Cyanobacteria bacterium P01_H01_bin.26]